MKFIEWCFRKYNIIGFSEGKITKKIAFPAIFSASQANLPDFLMSEKDYLKLMTNLWTYFLSINNYEPNTLKFDAFKIAYFKSTGVDYFQIAYAPNQGYICVHLPQQQMALFTNEFCHFNPRKVFCPLTQRNVIEMPAQFLPELFEHYYQDMGGYCQFPVQERLKQRQRISNLLEIISCNRLEERLNLIQRLALDYDNNDYLTSAASMSAYAITLRVFAELHYDALTLDQYQQLQVAARNLANYNTEGTLSQSLKLDVRFRSLLQKTFYEALVQLPHLANELVPFSELPMDVDYTLSCLIKDNTNNLLHGLKTALPENAQYNIPRFLPDENNYSETNEILLSSGGKYGHIAVTRIVKIGCSSDGKPLDFNESPHHYAYYKIENDLGGRVDDPQNNTVFSTYISRLIPFEFRQDSIYPSSVDPSKDPEAYQQAMEKTLYQLITVERMSILYRDNFSAESKKEATEWQRLNNLRQQLSGMPHFEPIYYLVVNTNQQQPFIRQARNLRGYAQQAGSCPAFSLKSYLSSILSPELAAWHNSFLQTYGAAECIQAMQTKIVEINALQNQRSVRPLSMLGDYALQTRFYGTPARRIPARDFSQENSGPIRR